MITFPASKCILPVLLLGKASKQGVFLLISTQICGLNSLANLNESNIEKIRREIFVSST